MTSVAEGVPSRPYPRSRRTRLDEGADMATEWWTEEDEDAGEPNYLIRQLAAHPVRTQISEAQPAH